MYKFFKRSLDIVVSFVALIIIIPLMLPIIIVLIFTAEGYIFYLQDRIGLDRRKFKIIKFATMLKDSPNLASGSITIKDDWRVTKPGKFLRKKKINELPQLLNFFSVM